MAKQTDRFDVTMKFDVTVKKVGDEGGKPWYGSTGEIEYTGMDYLQVCAVNGAIVKLAEVLADFGYDASVVAGFPVEVVKAIKEKLKK